MNIEIKVCGLTREADAKAAVEAGADYLGVIFYERSPRAVTAGRVKALMRACPEGTRFVGVFVNMARRRLIEIVSECGLYAVQLHGDEAAESYQRLPVPLWRAVTVDHGHVVPPAGEWPEADRFVVDAVAPRQYGGTGRVADWKAAARFASQQRVMLAGGLTVANVRDAIATVRPMGVDVSSGVESSPGRKDPDAIRQFIENVRAACREES